MPTTIVPVLPELDEPELKDKRPLTPFVPAAAVETTIDPDVVAAPAAVVTETMEGAANLGVPLVVDTGTGLNWDEAH